MVEKEPSILTEMYTWEKVSLSKTIADVEQVKVRETKSVYSVEECRTLLREEFRALLHHGEENGQLVDFSVVCQSDSNNQNRYSGRVSLKHELQGYKIPNRSVGVFKDRDGKFFFLCLVDIVGMNLPEVKLNGLGVTVVFTVHHSFYQWSGGAQNNVELTILDARIGTFERAYKALCELSKTKQKNAYLQLGQDPPVPLKDMGELKLWEFSVRFQNRYIQLDPFQQDAVTDVPLHLGPSWNRQNTHRDGHGSGSAGGSEGRFATADGIMAVIELAERLKEYVEDSSAPTSTGTSKREWVIVTSHADQVLANKPDLCDLHLHTRARKLHEHLSTIHYTDAPAETTAESQIYLKRFLPPSLLGLLTVEKGSTFAYDLPSQAQLNKAILNEAKLVMSTISEAGHPWMQAKLKKVDAIVCDEAAHIPSAMFSILLTSGAPFIAQLGDKQQAIAEVHSAAAKATTP
jgi:hypothetical protein